MLCLEGSYRDSFKAALDDYLMTLPDTAPNPGYVAANNNNNLLDWIITNSRALPAGLVARLCRHTLLLLTQLYSP